MSSNTAILYVTHRFDAPILEEWHRLEREAPAGHDVWLACDTGRAEPPRQLSPGRLHPFHAAEILAEFGPHLDQGHEEPNLIPGAMDLLLIDFVARNPSYSYVWLIEYDVRFSGNWRRLFDAFADNDAALLGTSLTRREERPEWPWWTSLQPAEGEESAEQICGFFPVIRLSRTAAAVLVAAYARGWRGHHECVVPTVLHREGLRIEDLGGDSDFVAPGNEGRFYTNQRLEASLGKGSFVWRPARAEPGAEADKLWHPVKQSDEIVVDATSVEGVGEPVGWGWGFHREARQHLVAFGSWGVGLVWRLKGER